LNNPHNIDTANAEKAIPLHAKWGKIAMQKARERYPSAKIHDYLHVNREQKGNYSVETFKLWLDENNKRFEVIVNIQFDTKSEKISKISLEKENTYH
jgi:hypothetical protein